MTTAVEAPAIESVTVDLAPETTDQTLLNDKAIARLTELASSYMAEGHKAAVSSIVHGVDSFEPTYLTKTVIETSYGEAKLPAELTVDEECKKLWAENGATSKNKIRIFEATVPVSTVLQYLPDWEPSRNHGSSEFVTVGTIWARMVIRARSEKIRKELCTPLSGNLGWMFSHKHAARLIREVEALNELVGNIIGLLISDDVYPIAKDSYETRLTAITAAAKARPTTNIESSIEDYVQSLMATFPLIHDIKNGFKYTYSPPIKLPSLAERLADSPDQVAALAEQFENENDAAIAAMELRGTQREDQARSSAAALQKEMMEIVGELIKKWDKVQGSTRNHEAAKARINALLERVGVVSDMLGGLTGDTPYQELARQMEQIALDQGDELGQVRANERMGEIRSLLHGEAQKATVAPATEDDPDPQERVNDLLGFARI